jgi:four helix bundle protein
MAKGYEDLDVWKESINLAELIYKITKLFPKDETYGLVSQMRRSAVSVASNIAEGAARNTKGEFGQFLGMSSGSLAELKTQTIIAFRAEIVDEENKRTVVEQVDKVGRMLTGLRKSLTSN